MRTTRPAVAQCLGCQNKSTEWADHAKDCLLWGLIEKEQARWQQRIYALLEKECPSINIDGSACDSGDPLDLTEAEVHQGLLHWQENCADVKQEHARLHAVLNTPELIDFSKAVVLEAAHQRERWDSKHDEGKTPEDWFWLVGYLAGKALHSLKFGDTKKSLHHIITTAAVLSNWHAQVLGRCDMRPGLPAEKQPQVNCCEQELAREFPSAGQILDGQLWTCPTCNRAWEHICDEAEGCSWHLAQAEAVGA